ncbi:structural protein [Bacillus phage vB_BauM_KLEB27-3]|nr:structural protein [Bacillus phage vB_BauM_KLEB27-3]
MTKAHKDRISQDGEDKGYSIRVGKTVPPNSANLAYVYSPDMGPEHNLLINDFSSDIAENGLPSNYEKERMMYPAEDFLLRELSGSSKLPSRNVALTDEFSTPVNTQDSPVPLYYQAESKGYFDAKGSTVVPYESGYLEKPIERIQNYVDLEGNDRETLLYLGSKISVTMLDGSDLPEGYRYKIKLVRSATTANSNRYRIQVMTNFKGNKDQTFVLRYERYWSSGTYTSDYVEVLNAYPFFKEIPKSLLEDLAENPKEEGEWKKELNEKQYAVIEADDNTYEVYAPSQVIVGNNITRPAHQFKYRIESNLKTKLSNANPGKINVGIAYLNETVFGVENLSGTLKKAYEDNFKPPYLDFENPHPELLSMIKEEVVYWQIDIGMAAEYWNEYDLVILTGFGFFDLSPYNDAIRQYLENGGRIWIDNGGAGENVLNFTKPDGSETFLTNVKFSKTAQVSAFKAAGNNTLAKTILNRLYLLESDRLDAGYSGVDPEIVFGAGESASNWTPIVRYSNNKPSVIYRDIYEKGGIMVSNCGIFRAIFHGEEFDVKLAMNIFLIFAENKWINSPWLQDYVYHRDNLFKEEYKGVTGDNLYLDDRNDFDSTQIVAKKIISDSTKKAMLPYLPSSFFNAKGSFRLNVESNSDVPLLNNSMESGTFNEETQTPVTSWTDSTVEAIPGWNTNHVAGSTPQFNHLVNISTRGSRAIEVIGSDDGTGTQAYWSNKTQILPGGSYRAYIWMSTSNANLLTGNGPSIGIYAENGDKIAISSPVLGSRDWVRVQVDFSIRQSQRVEIRIGFVDGNGYGTIKMDELRLYSIGSVYMTPENDGTRSLYAYATKARGEAFDLKSQGFTNADVTTYDPEVNCTITVRSFVYTWDNYLGRNLRKYGNYESYTYKIKRSDGIVNLGSLSTMIPALNAGAEWADRNDVYYEIFLGNANGLDDDSKFVNIEIYDTNSGRYFYNRTGEIVIRHTDLFYTGENQQVLVQARTNYYTIRATKRRYGLKVEEEEKIIVEYPGTIDERDAWHMRIKNGSFTKKELSYNELKNLYQYEKEYDRYNQRIFGVHYYSLPEYNRQVFNPSQGIKKKKEEIAEYINDNTIRIQNAPLYVKEGVVEGEHLVKADEEDKLYKSQNTSWLKSEDVKIYVDENFNEEYVEITEGFDIDYENGYVLFEDDPNGNVKVDYSHKNLRVTKRLYNNNKIKNEVLISSDRKVFRSKNKNWLLYPTPIIRIVPYGSEQQDNIADVASYTIDYEEGAIIFKEDIGDRVMADYAHSTNTEMKIRDYDAQNGFIYLENEVDFRQEYFVDYFYEEKYLEYRGYYDEEVGRFMHLDLNPSEGHYTTMPVVRVSDTNGLKYTSYEEVPSAKLMNKEVYIYILPYKDSFGNRNPYTIRHVFSSAEWEQVEKTSPTALLLAIVHIREHTSVNDVVVMDSRTRGGGLKENITNNEIKKRQGVFTSYWDMDTWEGAAYNKNGTLVIEIPKKVLKSEGGHFTEKQVRDIVRKHIAFGVYFIIDYV